jgi:hypothetical protein
MIDIILVVSLMFFAVYVVFAYLFIFNGFGVGKRFEVALLGYDSDEYWKNVREHDVVYAERMLGSRSIISPTLLDEAELEIKNSKVRLSG